MLGMTVRELGDRMTAVEMLEWIAFLGLSREKTEESAEPTVEDLKLFMESMRGGRRGVR